MTEMEKQGESIESSRKGYQMRPQAMPGRVTTGGNGHIFLFREEPVQNKVNRSDRVCSERDIIPYGA